MVEQKKRDEQNKILKLIGKEIIKFAPDTRGKERKDHFSSRFKTIHNP